MRLIQVEIVQLIHNQIPCVPPHKDFLSTAILSCMVCSDCRSSSEKWGVGIPKVMLYPRNQSIIAGHVALKPSSDTKSIIA
jgi:hypothetical protein